MTKTKSTKRALLMSALALIMCFSMLIGSTYAWFTDSVTSSGNKIQAGKLDIQLWMYDGTQYKDISNNANNIFGEGSIAQNNNAETLWEPGKTQVAYFMIKNAGNLALKYKVALEVVNVAKNLYEVMEYAVIADAKANTNKVTAWNGGKNVVEGLQTVTDADVSLGVDGEHYFALAIHMDEEAGNKYQEGIVNFDLTVLATQDTVEEDSFGNTYDDDADRDSNITVSSETELQEAFDDAKNGDVITFANDIGVKDTVKFNSDAEITLDLGGFILEGNTDVLLGVTAGNVVIQNGTIKNTNDNPNVPNTATDDTLVSVSLSGDAVAEIKDVTIETTGTGVLLSGNAKITELNANVKSYANANGTCDASSIVLGEESNARIDLISGGEYISTYSDEFIDAYSGSFSGVSIYPIKVTGTNASIGEISGGTFLGRADDGRNGATIYVNAGKIEKISGGYFGYCKYTPRNYPYFMITVNTANGASIDAITGGTFEYASGFGCDFENIVDQSGSKIVVRGEKATVSVKLSTSVKTKEVAIWDVIPK